MERLKRFAALLVTAAVIIICSRLPQLVTHMDTRDDTGQVRFESIPAPSLDLQNKPELTLLHKLYLAHYGDQSQISEDALSMDASQALACAKKGLDIYQGNGLLPASTVITREDCRPFLFYNMAENLYCFFWRVSLSPSKNLWIDLLIDDETGNILRFYRWCDSWVSPSYDLEDGLDTFAEIFLGSIGLELPPDTEIVSYWDDGLGAHCWWIIPTEHGEITFRIELSVFYNGFYTNT